MGKEFLIVSKEILPDYYDKVIEARNLLSEGKVKGVSEAVKMVGISRSTYYKYKDFVFTPSENSMGRKALISVMLAHKKGALSEVLNYISSVNGNILTINQNIPINDVASVIISLDISETTITIEEIIVALKKFDFVKSAKLVAME
ncbi:MAG: ACT domain-containing protein [Fusobacterium sp.]|uniref:ACT domain-containing protein n=1 Tax=Fusobacterium sp. TaxID=68766 RepID=UPI00294245ED|nr:ACT domain-containing protein [Fusobacterium sp.]MDY3060478.1 ACT domain-containing protein [Fusobacterium sp.]